MGFDPIPDGSSTTGGANGGGGGAGGTGGTSAGRGGAGAVGGSAGATAGSGGSTAGAAGSSGGLGGKGGTGGGTTGGAGGKGGISGSGGSTGGTAGKGGSSGTPGGGGRGGQGGSGPIADASPPVDSGNPPIDAGCSITCGSGPCPVRAGQPRVIVSRPFDQQITAIAVSADTLYFGTYSSQSDGAIDSIPLVGGAPTLLVAGGRIRELRLDGDTLYYVSEDGSGLSTAALRSIPTTGGLPRDIAQAPQIMDVMPMPEGIYFGRGGSGVPHQVVRTARDGTGARSVISLFGTLWGFAVEDGTIYVADYDYGGLIVQRPLGGGSGGTLTTSPEPITRPIIDGEDIVFVQGVATPDMCRSAVMSIPKSFGAPSQQRISPGTSGIDVMGLVRDDTHIYWSSTGVHGAVLRVQKGQTPEIIAADQQSASPPILGPRDVYWIARAGSTHEVRTVPK